MISALRGTLLSHPPRVSESDAAPFAAAAAAPFAAAAAAPFAAAAPTAREVAPTAPAVTPAAPASPGSAATVPLLSDNESDERVSPTHKCAAPRRAEPRGVIDLTVDSPTELEDGLPLDLCSVIDLVSSDDEDPSGPGLPRPKAQQLHAAAASPHLVQPFASTSAAAAIDRKGHAAAGGSRPAFAAVSTAAKSAPSKLTRSDSRASYKAAAPRFLVCAPSNVACDHLVSLLLGLASEEQRADELESQLVPTDGSRLLTLPPQWRAPEVSRGGLLGPDGLPWRPNVVRVGAGSLTAGRQELVQVHSTAA